MTGAARLRRLCRELPGAAEAAAMAAAEQARALAMAARLRSPLSATSRAARAVLAYSRVCQPRFCR